jgi:cytoskeletal protein CcmA (bactofilin family)
MWEKRKQEDFNARPPAVPPSTVEIAKEKPPAVPAPLPGMAPELPRSTAVIGKAMKIKGEIYSQEDLCVNGEVEGALELNDHCLTIGPTGKAHSSVRAREVVVQGTIHGNVEAKDKIAIRKDGKLVGDIKTAGIIIEDGAYFKGSIDIVKLDSKASAPAPKEPTQAAGGVQNSPSPSEPRVAAAAAGANTSSAVAVKR